jgi:hypothetical protein
VAIGGAAFLLVLIIAAFFLLSGDGTDSEQGAPPAHTSGETNTTK